MIDPPAIRRVLLQEADAEKFVSEDEGRFIATFFLEDAAGRTQFVVHLPLSDGDNPALSEIEGRARVALKERLQGLIDQI